MITSTSNARVKRLVNLRKKRKARDEEGVFLVEGIRMFREVRWINCKKSMYRNLLQERKRDGKKKCWQEETSVRN